MHAWADLRPRRIDRSSPRQPRPYAHPVPWGSLGSAAHDLADHHRLGANAHPGGPGAFRPPRLPGSRHRATRDPALLLRSVGRQHAVAGRDRRTFLLLLLTDLPQLRRSSLGKVLGTLLPIGLLLLGIAPAWLMLLMLLGGVAPFQGRPGDDRPSRPPLWRQARSAASSPCGAKRRFGPSPPSPLLACSSSISARRSSACLCCRSLDAGVVAGDARAVRGERPSKSNPPLRETHALAPPYRFGLAMLVLVGTLNLSSAYGRLRALEPQRRADHAARLRRHSAAEEGKNPHSLRTRPAFAPSGTTRGPLA